VVTARQSSNGHVAEVPTISFGVSRSSNPDIEAHPALFNHKNRTTKNPRQARVFLLAQQPSPKTEPLQYGAKRGPKNIAFP
jgi:hypothetical protein